MDNEKRTLKFGEVFGYGAGGMFAYGFQLMVTGYYLMYFMTDIAGFSTVLAASLYSAIQIIKLVTMLFSGVLIDSIPFKSGKYRTWVLVAGIVLGIFFPLSFFAFPLSPSAYVVVFMIVYTIHTLSYNVGWTAMRSVQSDMCKNKTDIIQLNTAAQIGGSVAGILYGFIAPALLAFFAAKLGANQQFFGLSCLFGVVIIIGAIVIYMMAGKYQNGAAQTVKAQKQERVSFFKMLSALKGPMIPYYLSYTFSNAQAGFFSTLLVYYSTYVLNDQAAAAIALTGISIASFVMSFISPFIAKKFSKKAIQIGCCVLSAIGYIALALFGGTAIPFIIIRCLITAAGTPNQIVMSPLVNDIGDSLEMKGEPAPRAFLQGLAGSTTRVGLILSTTIASFALAAIGYAPGVEFTSTMIRNMVILIAVGPAVVCALAAICMMFYNVDEKEIAEYNRKKFAQQ